MQGYFRYKGEMRERAFRAALYMGYQFHVASVGLHSNGIAVKVVNKGTVPVWWIVYESSFVRQYYFFTILYESHDTFLFYDEENRIVLLSSFCAYHAGHSVIGSSIIPCG
jgi:hypothetical protein